MRSFKKLSKFLNVRIVLQWDLFGCAKAAIKTAVKTKWDRDIDMSDHRLYIKKLWTLHFLAMANAALKKNKIKGRFVRKTYVRIDEIQSRLAEKKVMIALFISWNKYPHYAVLVGMDEKKIFIADTYSGKIKDLPVADFVERFNFHIGHIKQIEWMKWEHYPFMNRFSNRSIRIAKFLGILKPGTVYILEE